jgi:maltose O-acetyltransferase
MNWINRLIAYAYGVSRSLYYQRRYEVYRKMYKVHSTFGFNGTDIRLYGNGQIQLGSNSYIGSNSTICSESPAKVSIGSNCQISHNVRIYNQSADPDQDFRIQKTKPSVVGDIIIHDGVWIGANVFINPNIVIGENTVIGANSVVTKNLEPNAIYGGIPAKLIRYKS